MCLYPRIIVNPKYKPNKKNKGIIPSPRDRRLLYVPIACGVCEECKKKKQKEWLARLSEEYRALEKDKKMIFVTLTFSEEKLQALMNQCNNSADLNAVAKTAVRLFLERWRKKYKSSIKHWLIPEKGHNGTERLHLHGILWVPKEFKKQDLDDRWQNGFTYVGYSMNKKCIQYVTKYITKQDERGFNGRIFTSKGIGYSYLKKLDARDNEYRGRDTKETMRLENGYRAALPIYMRNKLYTETQRENLWLFKLEKQKRYILGKEFDVSTDAGIANYEYALREAQKKSTSKGYIDFQKEWEENRNIKRNTKNLQNFRVEFW